MQNYEEMFEAIDDLKARMLEDKEHAGIYETLLNIWHGIFEYLYVKTEEGGEKWVRH